MRGSPKPSPQLGIRTRSSYEIFRHRTRSGLLRSGSAVHHASALQATFSSRRCKSVPNGGGGDTLTFVKDLRARRIFSPLSESVNDAPEVKPGDDLPLVGASTESPPEIGIAEVSPVMEVEGFGGEVLGSFKGSTGGGGDTITFVRDVRIFSPLSESVYDASKIKPGDYHPLVGPSLDELPPESGIAEVASVMEVERFGDEVLGRFKGSPHRPNIHKNQVLVACSKRKHFLDRKSFARRGLSRRLMDIAKDELNGFQSIPSKNNFEKDENNQAFSLRSSSHKANHEKSGDLGNYSVAEDDQRTIDKNDVLQGSCIHSQKESLRITSPECQATQNCNTEVDLSMNRAKNDDGFGMQQQEPCHTAETQLGTESRSRPKLFPNPSSFGYKRLLPFLSDFTKDDLKGVQILPRLSYLAKVDGTKKRSAFPLDSNELVKESKKTLELQEGPAVKCNSVHGTPACESPILTFCGDYKPKSDDIEGGEQFPGIIKEDCAAISPVFESDGNPSLLTLSQVPTSANLVPSAPMKGILKRSTAECRGFCTCLGCSSFKLHAERAFDFSRKLMSESEEVIVGLVKELVCLRNLMAKNFTFVSQDSILGLPPSSQFDQVKKVYQRAIITEELAKDRLGQMMLDLNAYCKIPGPRVTFANSIETRMKSQFQDRQDAADHP